MTKYEAIEAMKKGEKVTHRFFTNDEFIRMEGTNIITEEGYCAPSYIFWNDRTSLEWLTDWEIYIPKFINNGSK